MQKKKIIKILCLVICCSLWIVVGFLWWFKPLSFQSYISPTEAKIFQKSSDDLIEQLNQSKTRMFSAQKDVDVYFMNLSEFNDLVIKNPKHYNFLWMGSQSEIFFERIKGFDHIFASTPDLAVYLSSLGLSSSFQPLFIDDKDKVEKPSMCVLNPTLPQCYFLVVGEQADVISILDNRHLKYHSYTYIDKKTSDKLMKEIKNISGIITISSKFSSQSLDISPFFLLAFKHLIPVLSNNIYAETIYHPTGDNFYLTGLFVDTLSYYTYKSDIEDFFDCLSCRVKKAKKASFILSHFYSTSVFKKRILNVISHQPDTIHVNGLMTIVSPTHAGLYNNGDYWIAKDLEDAFEPFYKEVLTVFPISMIADNGDAFIYIRGGIPLSHSVIHPDTVSLYYLLFPSVSDENKLSHMDKFIDNLIPEFKNVDAIIVASEKMAQLISNRGIEAYYIPQFTNINKFFPDFDETKKSEVLFVGNYLEYRTAAPAILKAGLPITIYGSNWPDYVSQAKYIDNRILRKYYSSAKIVLNDTRDSMKAYGFIINRIFDVTACETLVISDYMPEIEAIYGDTVPMWKTEEELVELVKYYLAPEHEAERLDKARRAKEITLNNFTAAHSAQKIQQIIDDIKMRKGIR